MVRAIRAHQKGDTEAMAEFIYTMKKVRKAHGDKVHAIRIYMHETGEDLERARKVIESNMVMGW